MGKLQHLHLLVVVFSIILTACTTTGRSDHLPETLAGSHWELVSIQSMDDSQGTLRIPDPSLYTVSFGKDGRASFRLNCNRATATWTADATGDDSGQLHFGPLAATRALCPLPSADEQVVRDMGYVRSYLLRGDMLYLSLMADGGIYEWRPAGRN